MQAYIPIIGEGNGWCVTTKTTMIQPLSVWEQRADYLHGLEVLGDIKRDRAISWARTTSSIVQLKLLTNLYSHVILSSLSSLVVSCSLSVSRYGQQLASGVLGPNRENLLVICRQINREIECFCLGLIWRFFWLSRSAHRHRHQQHQPPQQPGSRTEATMTTTARTKTTAATTTTTNKEEGYSSSNKTKTARSRRFSCCRRCGGTWSLWQYPHGKKGQKCTIRSQ